MSDDEVIKEEESLNPALNEPDALQIAQRGSATPSVTTKRKTELLVEARKDRRKWVQRVPLPYTSPRDPNNVWSLDNRLHIVQSSLACQRMGSATKILSELYGLETNRKNAEQVAQRVEELTKPFLTQDKLLFEEASDDILAEALLGKDENSQVVIAYHDFWTTLLKPECSLLVQGMRNFLRNLENEMTSDITTKQEERMANSMKQYLTTTSESLKSHVAWKETNNEEDAVRRSLESHVYGQFSQSQAFLDWKNTDSTSTDDDKDSTQFAMTEVDWRSRLDLLQFVNPRHLEIECLINDDDDDNVRVSKLLQEPIEALLSIDRYYSPYEKLQRILAVYQGVNAALSAALNQNNDSSDSKKLPSADDILPTIILAVLLCKPTKMFWNLRFIDVFCPQEHLRGEAGYAYTNLYGAVSFLHDLDMDKPNLSNINPEEFQKAIQERINQTKESIRQKQHVKEKEAISKIDMITKATKVKDISVHQVRKARLNGESVDLDWVLETQQSKNGKIEDESPFTARLPNGFHRTYGFLGAKPEDIRVSDLPKLLEEYKMLAHVTEQLLGERAGLVAMEKRKKQEEKQQLSEESMLYGMES